MSTVDEIVAAACELGPKQFATLRRKLDRLEKGIWAAELKAATAEMTRQRITDRDIDRLVMRRRHEGRR